jgi:hypothetical protein
MLGIEATKKNVRLMEVLYVCQTYTWFPISAIPDSGGDSGDFVFVCPVNAWADSFSNYIAMCHDTLN